MTAWIFRPLANLLLLLAVLGTAGCGSFIAHRMAQAPNTYPTWLEPRARVFLGFGGRYLTNFPAQFVEVGPPPARLRYRVIEPADYQLEVTSTNWTERGRKRVQFEFRADVPGRTNEWTAVPRGTVVLMHGYGLAEFSMAPWALRLAQDGWRCVLVDLRGHGKSTGKEIYWGTVETRDMSQLLDALALQGKLSPPVVAFGESYGASLALRWKTTDPRIGSVVAITPYGVLSNAVLNICREYAPILPRPLLRAGIKELPTVLNVPPDELDMTSVLARHPVMALFVMADGDEVVPPADARQLFERAAPGSRLIEVPEATHETVPYHFSELVRPVLAWLDTNAPPPAPELH